MPFRREARGAQVHEIGAHRAEALLEPRESDVLGLAATFVDFLRGFLDALKIQRASLVGSSLGGWVAARFALAYPDSVDRLVLVDAAGYADLARQLDPQTLHALRLGSRDDLRRLGPLTFYDSRYYQGNEAETAFLSERVTTGDGYTIERVIDAMIRGEDVLDRKVRTIASPTLIVWGREDKIIPLSFARRFHPDNLLGEVLGRSGQTKLSLSEVALQAGVSRPTLYRWFASKGELLDAFGE